MHNIQVRPENFRHTGLVVDQVKALLARLLVLGLLLAAALILCAALPFASGEGREAWFAWFDNPQALLSFSSLGEEKVLSLTAAWIGLLCFFPRRMGFDCFWFSCSLPGVAQALLVFGTGMPLPFCLFIGGVQAWVQRAMLIPRLLGHEWGMAAVFAAIIYGMWHTGLLNIIITAKYPLFFHLFFLALGMVLYNILARAKAWPACVREMLACADRLDNLRKFVFSSPRLREMLDMLIPVIREYAERPKTADAPFMTRSLSRALRNAEKSLGITASSALRAGTPRSTSGSPTMTNFSSPDGAEKARLALSEVAYLFARKVADTYVPALDDDFQENEPRDEGEKTNSSDKGNATASPLAANSDYWGEFKY